MSKAKLPALSWAGGILEHVLRDILVRCLPTDIPASFDADVSTLQINTALKAKDLKVPAGVELVIDLEAIIVNIVAPTILEETAAPAAGVTAGEPEVIKKGKPEEGADAAAATAKPGAPLLPQSRVLLPPRVQKPTPRNKFVLALRLLVGLGNPGSRYDPTRHNVGYRVIDQLREGEALVGVRLLKPESVYMNDSGNPVAELARKNGILPEEILVICDDFSIPLGQLRLRLKGSSGGHNGLNSIITVFGNAGHCAFARRDWSGS